jgi:hypothetical protein
MRIYLPTCVHLRCIPSKRNSRFLLLNSNNRIVSVVVFITFQAFNLPFAFQDVRKEPCSIYFSIQMAL